MNRFVHSIFLLIIITAFLFDGEAYAQMVQYGKVVEMNTHGKSLSGVSVTVSSAHDCQPTISDVHGVFRLSFAEHQTGDVVHGLRAKKYGYEVVNIHVTRDGWTLTDRDTLKIVMATTEKLNDARMRYYDLIETACVERYDATMNVLDQHYANRIITMPEYQYWKMEAENELQRAYQNMDALADELARTEEEELGSINEVINARLNEEGNVLQAYSDFTTGFPLNTFEEMEAKAGTDSVSVTDSLYNEIMVLQTYVNLFESDFVVSGSKYAKSCAYLGVIYKQKGWTEASKKYLQKALRMYEILDLIEGVEVKENIGKIKELLKE